MSPSTRLPRFFLLPIILIFLTQCTHLPQDPSKRSSLGASAEQHSLYPLSAARYLALAQQEMSPRREELQLMAIGRLLEDGDWREAEHLLSDMKIDSVQKREKTILAAKMELSKRQPHAAIRLLSSIQEIDSLTSLYQRQYHQILADAYERLGRSQASLRERIKLQKKLKSSDEQAENIQRTWLTLTKLPPAEVQTLALETSEDDDLQAWVKLALIARERDIYSSYNQLVQWQRQYPLHGANQTLPSPLSAAKANLYQSPKQIALLLPFSGPLAGPGNAIRAGIINAAVTQGMPASQIVSYDTTQSSIDALYRQALIDGAEAVVGPLTKNDVAKMLALDHAVPTLLLNDIGGVKMDQNTYQMGLSPIDEAKEVALKARQQGRSRAIVIAPANVWGREVVDAFQQTWENSDGVIVDHLTYDNETPTNEAIRQLLKVPLEEKQDKSQHQVKQKKGKQDYFAMRRQDFDMVFLLAYPSKARQILPRLRYYYLGDIPVYATSAIYSGYKDKMHDKDLDGIIFCDMPWVFQQEVGKNVWPEQLNSYNRLYALGQDSYAAITQLNRLRLFSSITVNHQNGLYFNRTQKSMRAYAWGQFKQGIPTKINI